jgi:DNA primase
MSNQLLNYINTHKQDAVVYKAMHLVEKAGDDMFQKSQAVDDIKSMLACIQNEVLLEGYVKLVAGITGFKFATLVKVVKGAQDDEKKKTEEQHVGDGQKAIPKWVNKDRLNDIGFDWKIDTFYPENTGMYFPYSSGYMVQLSNFVIKPIVQIISDDEMSRRRITEIANGSKSHVFEFPSSAFTSTTKFETILMDQGYYLFKDGFTQPHLNKIKSYYLSHYPIGYEITNLGWQEEGFFAFSNVIYFNGVKEFDEYGLAEVDGIKYLSMGSSNILKNLRKGTDIYKNDKHLRYDPAPISFKSWSKLMLEVYEEKAMMGIAWCLLAVNRDIVSARTSYCPIPYCYGAAQSGKSQFVASLIALFTKGLRPFNLNQGTEFAFWEYMGRFRNVLMAFNEFDVMSVEEKRIRAFKGVADVEGRNKGSGRKNKSETMEVACLPVLLGQYLATMDDNSLLGRTTPEKFVENNDRPPEQILAFEKLKAYEEVGMTGLLINILEQRNFVSDNYLQTYSEVTHALKADFAKEGFTPKNRVIENYACMLSLMRLYNQDVRLDFAFTYDDFYRYCKNKVMNLNTMIGESNSLGEFWKMLEHLADNGYIEPGWEYKIETATEVKSIIAEKSSKKIVSFDKPTRLLYLRLNSCYPIFAKEKKNISGKAAIGEATIKSYLEDQPYYVGAQSGGNFKSKKHNLTKNTSSMVLNYDMLQANEVNLLDTQEEAEEAREQVVIEGKIQADARIQNNFGTEKALFVIYQDQSYHKGDMKVDNPVYTKCFWINLDLVKQLRQDSIVKATGFLNVRTWEGRQHLTLEVSKVEFVKTVEPEEPVNPAQMAKQLSISDQAGFKADHTRKDEF